MKNLLGAAFLLAGTAIGSGMISLPMVLAKFGIINTIIIMLFFAGLTYITALIRSDLNLNSHKESTLKNVGHNFQCPFMGNLGDILLKLLSFALLSAYIFGFSSMLVSLSENTVNQSTSICISSVGISLIFLLASEVIIHINKFLFVALFGSLMTLIFTLFVQTPIDFIPQHSDSIKLNEWSTLVPVVFTSFGFQGSIHSMTKFCKNDRELIKKACFLGSLIPAVVYIAWTAAILLVVANTDPQFFQLMLKGKATDVGQLVAVLSRAVSSKSIHAIVWLVSISSILTSIFGVGVSLLDIFQHEWKMPKWKSLIWIVFAPASVSIFIPNAFIRILNVSGVILAIIAIIVPIAISWKMQKIGNLKCNLLLNNKVLTVGAFICGTLIVSLGIMDILFD